MAARFESAIRRGYWSAFFVAAITDFGVALVISWMFENKGGQMLFVAALIVAVAYAFQFIYGLLSVLRAAALFFLFDKEHRIAAVVDQMAVVKMPRPREFYSDAREYFLEVARSPEASDEAKLLAGVTIGNLEALRSTNRGFLTMSSHVVLESAIQRYGKLIGTVGYD